MNALAEFGLLGLATGFAGAIAVAAQWLLLERMLELMKSAALGRVRRAAPAEDARSGRLAAQARRGGLSESGAERKGASPCRY